MSSITTLQSTDSGAVSRPVINTNFSNLNTDKAELVSPTFTTPDIGVATATSVNGNTLTTGTGTITITGTKTLTVSDTATVSGTNTGDNAANSTADMLLGTVQSVTAEKKFTNEKITLLGSSTGKTIFSSANTGATDYTQTLQARDGTIANLDNVTYIGTTSVALNRGSAALTLAGITLTTPNIGTPSAGVLTNATGLPAAAVLAGSLGTGAYVMDSSLQVSTIELGHATDTTLARVSAGVISVEGVTIPTISSTSTLTNKRVTKRTPTVTQSATPTINTDITDVAHITGLAQAITSMTTNLTGTPVEGDTLRIDITGTAARAITWGASFENGAETLPTTTVTTARLDVGFYWNTATSKWRCMAQG